jgi:hypothetical protein
MKVDLFLTADYANITGDGKLNVMGIFREVNAINFPARHSSMHVVIRLYAELGEFGATRDLVVKLLDADGTEIVGLSGQVDVPKPAEGRTPQVNVILELKDIIFPKPGPYQFIILLDKDHKASLTIYVNQLEALPKNQG